MKRASKLLLAGVCLVSVGLSSEAFAQKARGEAGMRLDAGTMQAGGQLWLSTSAGIPLSGTSKATTSYQLNLAPSFGIFAARGLELLVGLNYSMSFGDNSEYAAKLFGFDFGGRYCFDLFVLFLYVGLNFGLDLTFPADGPERDLQSPKTITFFSWGIPLGLLIPFNKHVALDVGLRINFSKNLTAGAADRLGVSVPVGYMGVQAFF